MRFVIEAQSYKIISYCSNLSEDKSEMVNFA
jgi:hypothetical protein